MRWCWQAVAAEAKGGWGCAGGGRFVQSFAEKERKKKKKEGKRKKKKENKGKKGRKINK